METKFFSRAYCDSTRNGGFEGGEGGLIWISCKKKKFYNEDGETLGTSCPERW